MQAMEKLRGLGYEVGHAFGHDSDDIPTVYHVSGYGISLYIADNDSEAWEALLDTTAHEERVYQHENPDEDHIARMALLEDDG
jgi:hypothetical protein